jgi:hypothetical protein
MRIVFNPTSYNGNEDDIDLNLKDLNIIPLFSTNLNSSVDVVKHDYEDNYGKKTVKDILLNKKLTEPRRYLSNYSHCSIKETDYFKGSSKDKVLKTIKTTLNNEYELLVDKINRIANFNFQYRENAKLPYKTLIIDNYITSGNNMIIKNRFNSFNHTSRIRNNEKLRVYYGSVFKETNDGLYPVLITGIDKDKTLSFKQDLINVVINEEALFDSIKVFVDYEWYFQSCNKSLRVSFLQELKLKYPNYELILFDGKEFANKNMFCYQLKSFPTLKKQKEFYSQVETLLNQFLKNNFSEYDYISKQKEFLDVYNEILKTQSEKAEPVAELLETRSLSAEEMSLIESLMQNDADVVSTNVTLEPIPVNELDLVPTPIVDSSLFQNYRDAVEQIRLSIPEPESIYGQIRHLTTSQISNESLREAAASFINEVSAFPTVNVTNETVIQQPVFDIDEDEELRRIANEIQNG